MKLLDKLITAIKNKRQAIKDHQKAQYWKKRQLEFLQIQIIQDLRWLGSDGTHGVILERYKAMIADDWYRTSHVPIDALRSTLADMPLEKMPGVLRYHSSRYSAEKERQWKAMNKCKAEQQLPYPNIGPDNAQGDVSQ